MWLGGWFAQREQDLLYPVRISGGRSRDLSARSRESARIAGRRLAWPMLRHMVGRGSSARLPESVGSRVSNFCGRYLDGWSVEGSLRASNGARGMHRYNSF